MQIFLKISLAAKTSPAKISSKSKQEGTTTNKAISIKPISKKSEKKN